MQVKLKILTKSTKMSLLMLLFFILVPMSVYI